MKTSATTARSERPPRSMFDLARETGLGAELLDQIGQEIHQRKRKRKAATRRTLAAVIVIGLLLWAVPYFKDTGTVATHAAHRQSLELADGSRVDLNAQTALHTDFRYGRRSVRLAKGEAFFAVSSDPQHPFLVETPSGTVRVTGTQFNVRIADDTAEITLIEGTVEFQSPAGTATLAPKEQYLSGAVRPLSDANIERVLAWRNGRIILDGMSMADAASRLSAFHGKPIAVSPDIASLQLGGSFPLDDLQQFFDALKDVSPVQVINRGDGSYHIAPR